MDCLIEIYEEQLLKLYKGNDLWAMVVLSLANSSDAHQEQYLLNGIPDKIQEVLREFDELFQSPTELRPSRAFDHAISLLPNVVPVNSRPYMYSP
jgi:hypothetical protein